MRYDKDIIILFFIPKKENNMKNIEKMQEYREKMNDLILNADNKNIKRFFAIDHNIYKQGALDKKTKELMGLVASTVLRCNDCIFYHLDQCYKENVSDEELFETTTMHGLIPDQFKHCT